MNVHDRIREIIAYDFVRNEYIVRHDYDINGTRFNHEYIYKSEEHYEKIHECREKTILDALKVAVHIDGVCYPKVTIEPKWSKQDKIPWKLKDELTLN